MNKEFISKLFEKIKKELNIQTKIELKVINTSYDRICGTFCMRGNTPTIHINKYYNKDIKELHDTICHELAHKTIYYTSHNPEILTMYHTKRHKNLVKEYKKKTKYLLI